MEEIDGKLKKAFECFDSKKFHEAEKLYKECLQSAHITLNEMTAALHGLGFVYAEQKKFEQAREIYQELRENAQTKGNFHDEHIAIHQLGMVERMAENIEAAQALFEEEYLLLQNTMPDFQLGFAANLYEKGILALKSNQLIDAEKIMLQSLKYAEQSGDLVCLGCSLRGLGEIFTAKREKEHAKQYYSKAVKVFEKVGDTFAIHEVKKLMRKI